MDWAKIQSTLETWFLRATGVKAVTWETQQADMVEKPIGILHMLAFQNVGTDERRTTYDATQPAGKELVREVCGHRLFTLSCKVRSRDNRPGNAAIAFIEKARTSLAKLWVLDMFKTAELGFVGAEASIDLPGYFDNREESFAAMDVRFCAVVNETDLRDRGGFIETVELETAMTGAGTAGDAWLADQNVVAGLDTDEFIIDRKGALVKDEAGDLLEAES